MRDDGYCRVQSALEPSDTPPYLVFIRNIAFVCIQTCTGVGAKTRRGMPLSHMLDILTCLLISSARKGEESIVPVFLNVSSSRTVNLAPL